MHRWAQSQIFRSLSFYLSHELNQVWQRLGRSRYVSVSGIKAQQTNGASCAVSADNIISEAQLRFSVVISKAMARA